MCNRTNPIEEGKAHLDALGDVNHQNHHVNDLCAAYDCSDEGRMPRAVHEGELQDLARKLLQMLRHGDGEGREAQVKGDTPLLALRMLVQGCC